MELVESPELQVPRVKRVTMEVSVPKDPRVTEDLLVCKDFLDLWVHREKRVYPVQQVLQDLPESQDRRVHLVVMVVLVLKVSWDHMVPEVPVVKRVNQVCLVPLDPLDHLDLLVNQWVTMPLLWLLYWARDRAKVLILYKETTVLLCLLEFWVARSQKTKGVS